MDLPEVINVDLPELINAIGIAVAAVLTAWQAHTSKKVHDLEARLALVESERDEFKKLFRIAIRHIREWMTWAMHHAPGTHAPPIPNELKDEV